MTTLRPYQVKVLADEQAALERIRHEQRKDTGVVVMVMPTGAGKTRTVAHKVAREGEPAAIVAHRQELVGQLSCALAGERVRHGIVAPPAVIRDIVKLQIEEVGASYFDPNAKTKVCGIDTLNRLPESDPWFDQVRQWVCDEGHHVQEDNKWGKGLKRFRRARGLLPTATPVRTDRKGLGAGHGGIADAMVEGPQPQELMDWGFLTTYQVRCPDSDVDYSRVRTTKGGELSSTGLREAVHASRRIVGDVVDKYLEHAAGKRGITFAVDVEEASKLADAYNARGVPAAVIHGAMLDTERISLMRRFRSGDLLQLCNCDILGEGVDVPAVEVVSMARKTLSYSLYAQQLGRMLRPFPGKTHGLLLDHVGNFMFHKPIQKRRIWTLEGELRMARKSDGVPMAKCAVCTQPYERFYPACPYCGAEPVVADRSSPAVVDGDLSLLDEAAIARLCEEEEQAMAPPVFRVPYNATAGIVHNLQQAYTQRLGAHHATLEAQRTLQEAMQLWGGMVTHREGQSLRVAWRRFFHEFGIDVMSAKALDAERAGQLERQVRGAIQ